MVYSLECDGDKHNECFDFDCPASHPVKLPEIHLYVRILGYEGGAHMFADGSDVSKYLKDNFGLTKFSNSIINLIL